MGEKKKMKVEEPSQKFTYEQLENIAVNLTTQRNQLQAQLNEANKIIDNFNILGMLLSILGKESFFDPKFIDRCSLKIQTLVTETLDEIDKETKEKK